MDIKAVDLFCGVGGLTYGLQKAGIPVVAGIDIDGSCEYAYTQNNHAQFIKKSIEEVTGKEVCALFRGVDVKVLVGCAPCQPFSSHQKDKKHRSKHKDWKLLYQFSRLVKEVRPHIVSMENVPELKKETVFLDFVSTLKEENYVVNYDVVNVADYGVPQRRKRLILLASQRQEIKIPAPTHNQHITVQDAIGNLPIVQAGKADKNDGLHIAPALSNLNLQRIKHSIPGGTWRDWPDELKLRCHKSETGQTYTSVYGRMRWDDLSPTITTQFIGYGTGRFGHPDQDRALTLREGAILQSFPPNYQFVSPKEPIQIKKIARHIGNAVPPRLGEVIGQSIINTLLKNSKNMVDKNEQGV
ncbi:DNA cytosine methyltransferase [Treponema socranskii]|uniref:DNA cytosine methyltransferase n=1 Tax=Treponema socranskii TaxID=53419 RepID=UPI0023EF591C|nr:DNA cytosine methyltransferase [Treponema socranskii]